MNGRPTTHALLAVVAADLVARADSVARDEVSDSTPQAFGSSRLDRFDALESSPGVGRQYGKATAQIDDLLHPWNRQRGGGVEETDVVPPAFGANDIG